MNENATPVIGIGTEISMGSLSATVVAIHATASSDRLGNRTVSPWVTLESKGQRETVSGQDLEQYL